MPLILEDGGLAAFFIFWYGIVPVLEALGLRHLATKIVPSVRMQIIGVSDVVDNYDKSDNRDSKWQGIL